MIDIYVINLIHRTDRKNKLLSIYKKYPEINLIFIEAVKHENGAIGCFLSHQKCLEIAKENNLDYIIVLEDDSIPVENINFYDELQETLNFLRTIEWNLFLAVGNKIEPQNIKEIIKYNTSTFIKVNLSNVTNLVIYNKNTYDFFLNANAMTEYPIDKYWHYKLEAVLKVPFMIETYKSHSDIENKSTNYNKVFNRTLDIINKHIKNNLKK